MAGLGSRSIGVILTRNDVNFPIFYSNIGMSESQHLANPHTGLVQEGEQEFIPGVATRINELGDLCCGQRLGQPPLTFGGDDPRVLWFCLGNAVQEWFVAASIRHGQAIQGKFWQGFETDVKVVEAMDGPQDLINGGIGSLGQGWFNGDHSGITSAQPGNESGQLGDIDVRPAEVEIT